MLSSRKLAVVVRRGRRGRRRDAAFRCEVAVVVAARWRICCEYRGVRGWRCAVRGGLFSDAVPKLSGRGIGQHNRLEER